MSDKVCGYVVPHCDLQYMSKLVLQAPLRLSETVFDSLTTLVTQLWSPEHETMVAMSPYTEV